MLARADLVKASVLESNVAYLRISGVDGDLASAISAAQRAAATNPIVGTVLDLRFADGDNPAAAKAAANLFAAKKLPLAVLVNGQTRGAAAELAADLQRKRAGLIFGSPVDELKPDIAVTVKSEDEKNYFNNPYAAVTTESINASPDTNKFSPFIDHTSEADLVRAKIKDGDEDETIAAQHPAEPQTPFIRDPVLARAVDLLKALAVVRPPRS